KENTLQINSPKSSSFQRERQSGKEVRSPELGIPRRRHKEEIREERERGAPQGDIHTKGQRDGQRRTLLGELQGGGEMR
ncbi:hypothetical protein NPIL_391371, partial [Nephila pilipes]